jgi:hypothetical protein
MWKQNYRWRMAHSGDVCWQAPRKRNRGYHDVFVSAGRVLGGAAAALRRPLPWTVPAHGVSTTVRAKEIHLQPGELWSGTVGRGTRIVCREGRIWLTQNGDARDYVLRVGEEQVTRQRAHVVISTFTEAAAMSLDVL